MPNPRIKIVDSQFAHGTSLGSGDLAIHPNYFEWYRGPENINDIVVVTESSFHLVDRHSERIKIGFLVEPPLISPGAYQFIRNPANYSKFSFILTYDKSLLSVNERFRFYPFGGCWLLDFEKKVYPKSLQTSIIASEKSITYGHQLRHQAIKHFSDKITGIFGRGYQYVYSKLSALRDYRFSIVIENDPCDSFFSEKLIDCFLTGTIPIYFGCPSIGDYFDKSAMLCFSNIAELDACLGLATIEFYESKAYNIITNFEKAKQYAVPEDCLWNDHFRNLFT